MDRPSESSWFSLQAWEKAGRSAAAPAAEMRLENIGQAYAVQHAASAAQGAIGAWKVLNGGAGAPPLCAPVPLACIRSSGARVRAGASPVRLRVVLCCRLGASLPSYAAPYSVAEVEGAIGSLHAGAELIRGGNGNAPRDELAWIAGGLSAGALVVGAAARAWQNFDHREIAVRIRIGRHEDERRQGRAEMDIPRTLQWLAEFGAAWADGLIIGHIVEIGLGIEEVMVPAGSKVRVAIEGFGEVAFRLE